MRFAEGIDVSEGAVCLAVFQLSVHQYPGTSAPPFDPHFDFRITGDPVPIIIGESRWRD
jgi:hypothetical protein